MRSDICEDDYSAYTGSPVTGNLTSIEGDVEAQGGVDAVREGLEGKENAIMVRTDVVVKKNWRWRG